MRRTVKKILVLTLFLGSFLAYAGDKNEFVYEQGKCVERLTEMLNKESENAEKAKEEVCAKKIAEIKKKMLGTSVREKAKLRGKLRKAKNCNCNVDKISIKKKREILEMALAKLKEAEANFKCSGK